MTFRERELGKVFKAELEKQKFRIFDQGYQKKTYSTSFKVHLNKPVRTHTGKFKQFWRMKGLYPKKIPSPQPEIDMILVDDLGIMRAVEIKVIKKTKEGIKPSYYEGIGQTLAYLSFGFEQVALWQCFDGNSLTNKEIFEYNKALGRIRIPIAPFVCATYFRIVTEGQKLRIQTRIFYRGRPSEWKDGIGIFMPDIGEFKMVWNCCNPFLRLISPSSGNIKKEVNAIHEFLELQKNSIWEK